MSKNNRVTVNEIPKIWELARDYIGTEKAYDALPAGEEKRKASEEATKCFQAVRAMGDEAMQVYMAFLGILRNRETA